MERQRMTKTVPNRFKIFADCHCPVGEIIIWSETEQALYCLDLEGHVGRARPTDEYQQYKLNLGKTGGIALKSTAGID